MDCYSYASIAFFLGFLFFFIIASISNRRIFKKSYEDQEKVVRLLEEIRDCLKTNGIRK